MTFVTNSTDDPNSRYVQGGVTDRFANRLGWWERTPIVKASDDQTIPLESRYNKRPDLLAYDLYGKAVLAWLILEFNLIVDVNTQFVTGSLISFPTSARVYSSILTNQTGGNVLTQNI